MLISPFTKKIGWGISIKFCPMEGGRNLNKPILKSSNTWGVGQGQDVEALNWWTHNLTYLLKYVYNVYNLVTSMEHSKIRVLKKNPNFKPSYFILWCSTIELTENLWWAQNHYYIFVCENCDNCPKSMIWLHIMKCNLINLVCDYFTYLSIFTLAIPSTFGIFFQFL